MCCDTCCRLGYEWLVFVYHALGDTWSIGIRVVGISVSCVGIMIMSLYTDDGYFCIVCWDTGRSYFGIMCWIAVVSISASCVGVGAMGWYTGHWYFAIVCCDMIGLYVYVVYWNTRGGLGVRVMFIYVSCVWIHVVSIYVSWVGICIVCWTTCGWLIYIWWVFMYRVSV